MSIAEVSRTQPDVSVTPLLGTAKSATGAELALAGRFDALHQLLYTRGGVRPTNAAIEEVGKLVFLRLCSGRESCGEGEDDSLRRLFSGSVPDGVVVDVTKRAFVRALRGSELSSHGLDGVVRPLWPLDEPFRLSEPTVLRAALRLVDETIGDTTRVADPLGTAFDAFLSGRYDHAGGLGTYLTPSSIARMMAEVALDLLPPGIVDTVEGPVFADPFCGTGRFLVALLDAAEERRRGAHLRGLLDGGLVGADQSASAVAKSGLNLLLYGARRPTVFTVSDSVTDPGLDGLRGRLAAVLTNPPFGGGKYSSPEGIARTRAVLPSLRASPTIDPSLAGLVRSLDLLRPGGVLGIVLPEGVVNGRQFHDLLRDPGYHVAASVSLPTATFSLSGTVAKTSAVFIRKAPRGARTVLARIDHVGFHKQAGRPVPDPAGSEIPGATTLLARALTSSPGGADVEVHHEHPLVATVAADGLTSLDPSRLDPGAVQSRHALLVRGGARLGDLLAVQRRRRTPRRREVPFVSVLHVDQLGTVDWNAARRYEPVTPGQAAGCGDVLVSLLNPSKLRAAVIPPTVPTVECSAEFGVFTTTHSPYAILGLLYKPEVQAQLRPLGSGTSSSRRRIVPDDVLDLVVPAMGDEELRRLGADVQRLVHLVENSRSDLDDLHSAHIPHASSGSSASSSTSRSSAAATSPRSATCSSESPGNRSATTEASATRSAALVEERDLFNL